MTITEYDDCRQCGDTFPVGMLVDGVCRFCRETASEWLGRMRNPNTCNVDRRAVRHVESLLAEVKRLTPRVIETQAELREFRIGTLIRDPRGRVWQRTLGEWVALGRLSAPDAVPLPARLLYVPEGGEG